MTVADSRRWTKIQILELLLKNIWNFIITFLNIQQEVKYFIQYHHSSTKHMCQLTVRFIYDSDIQSRERYKSVRLVFVNHSEMSCRWREYDSWNVTRSQLRQDSFLFLLRNFITRNVRHVCIVQCLCMDDMQMAFCHVLCLKAGRRHESEILRRHKFRSCVSSGCDGICKVSSLLALYESTYDRLCGLVVRVSGYRYRGLGSRFPMLPDFLSGSESGTGCTQPREPREVNWGATWIKISSDAGSVNRD